MVSILIHLCALLFNNAHISSIYAYKDKTIITKS